MHVYKQLLAAGKPILLYCGNHDFMTNCQGLQSIANLLYSTKQMLFTKPMVPYAPSNDHVYVKSYRRLTLAKFIHSGHEVRSHLTTDPFLGLYGPARPSQLACHQLDPSPKTLLNNYLLSTSFATLKNLHSNLPPIYYKTINPNITFL
ncbi:hypothetical protein DSO57_1035418 [Entomophthora muscae]|uniref:Uncharacterized protein n=1 Tax=Entomophthora muscae TaxID=34485 RepID=A0ACC2S1N1_9FUNG|nr:hypothetical protein DSO57_1035418 [Entomophthora muscae]